MEAPANSMKARRQQLHESIDGRRYSAPIEPDFGDVKELITEAIQDGTPPNARPCCGRRRPPSVSSDGRRFSPSSTHRDELAMEPRHGIAGARQLGSVLGQMVRAVA